MLDGVYAGLQRGHHAGLAVAVRRDDAVGHAGDLDDGPQLRAGELLVDRMVHFGEYATRGEELDEPGVTAQLLPSRPRTVCRPIGQPELAAHAPEVSDPGHRIAMYVTVSAGSGQ